MKPDPSLYLRRSIRAASAVGLACLLAACAAQKQAPVPAAAAPALTEEQAIETLLSGGASLDCGQGCAESWRRARPELSRRFNAGDWRGLTILVMATNYRQDLAYYYLGRAAEELGAGKNALGYYRTALSLTTGPEPDARCAASKEGCDGINLPSDETLHIQLVEGGLARRPTVARARPKPGPSPAGTTATTQKEDGWVDPPPASE